MVKPVQRRRRQKEKEEEKEEVVVTRCREMMQTATRFKDSILK
jgi:hypothetical protein